MRGVEQSFCYTNSPIIDDLIKQQKYKSITRDQKLVTNGGYEGGLEEETRRGQGSTWPLAPY